MLGLLTLSALLRGIVLWRFGGDLSVDVDQYLGLAHNLAAGNGFTTPGTGVPTAYRPPLYPLFLAALLAAGGTPLAIGIAQLVLGTGTVALTVCLGRRLGLGRLSLVAGLLVAVDPLLLRNTALIMTETLASFLAVLLLWVMVGRSAVSKPAALAAASPGPGAAPHPGPLPTEYRRRFWVGVVFGLCCLCRPVFIVYGLLAAVLALAERARNLRGKPGPSKFGVARAVASSLAAAWPAVVGAVLILTPWAVRNACVMGRPIVTTTHGGYTLLLGHNPVYYREVVEQPWGRVWEDRSLKAWQAGLEKRIAATVPPVRGELARDGWMYEQAWRYIDRDLGRAGRAGLTLLGRFWNVAPLGGQADPLGRLATLAIGVFYSCTLLGMLLGVARLRAGEWSRWWPMLAMIGALTLVHALYWADLRMRAPLIPAIAVLAARGILRSSVANSAARSDNLAT